METKTCKVCGRELPETSFRKVKGGGYGSTCKECISEALKEAAFQRKTEGGGKQTPFSDPDFDGKEPGEVMRMMGRAKKWLESRGFVIQLSGEYHETKIRKLKFE